MVTKFPRSGDGGWGRRATTASLKAHVLHAHEKASLAARSRLSRAGRRHTVSGGHGSLASRPAQPPFAGRADRARRTRRSPRSPAAGPWARHARNDRPRARARPAAAQRQQAWRPVAHRRVPGLLGTRHADRARAETSAPRQELVRRPRRVSVCWPRSRSHRPTPGPAGRATGARLLAGLQLLAIDPIAPIAMRIGAVGERA
jgi:hypothetical protein